VPAPVPYANLTNPQTLNLYAIVRDNPESYADLDGHLPDPTCCTELEPLIEEVDKIAEPLIESAVARAGPAVATFSKLFGAIGGAVIFLATPTSSNAHEQQLLDKARSQEQNSEQKPEPEPAAAAGGRGTIYRVPGSATRSGKPYIGRHNKPNPAKTRRSKDGRDRSQAQVVDTYNAADTKEGRTKEQEHINKEGLKNLDNMRNEIKPENTNDKRIP
jgi:hypothetical protein